MNIIGCLDKPTSGQYLLEGTEVSKLNDNQLAEIRGKKIGFVFQSFNLLPRNTALANVELPLIYNGSGNRRQRALQALESVGLAHRASHKPSELAGGEQQRVAIARALINNPSLILADEPTGNLDTQTSKEIMLLFQQLNQQGITIVLVTHEADIAAYTQRTIKIRDGQIEQ
jgi:putative ABC transport system ATP-binding protein